MNTCKIETSCDLMMSFSFDTNVAKKIKMKYVSALV